MEEVHPMTREEAEKESGSRYHEAWQCGKCKEWFPAGSSGHHGALTSFCNGCFPHIGPEEYNILKFVITPGFDPYNTDVEDRTRSLDPKKPGRF
jgi:hypothetical protein